jgi:hypothetical protein
MRWTGAAVRVGFEWKIVGRRPVNLVVRRLRRTMDASQQNGGDVQTVKKSGCLKYCLFAIAFVLIVPTLFTWLVFPGITYIGFRPSGERYAKTVFEFRYGHATRYVDDPGNQMQWVYGALPDSITVENGIRKIVYNEPKAIIKSSNDSMDAQIDKLKHKGYMGIWSDGTDFFVDKQGVVHER